MFIGQAHSWIQQARLAITLAWVAGYTNILSFLICGQHTSHATGTLTQWGRDLVEVFGNGRWDLLFLTSFLLFTFVLGAMASTTCTEIGRRRGWESIYVLPMTIQAILLTCFALGNEFNSPERLRTGTAFFAMLALASIAMGLQNATITRISSGVVRTTHMTGVITDLGTELVHVALVIFDRVMCARHSQDNQPQLQSLRDTLGRTPSVQRLVLLMSIAGSFALGAGLGALAFNHQPHWAMYPPVLFLLWIIYHDVKVPICEIEPSTLMHDSSGLNLPAGIAVFTLRKGESKLDKAHRLPDLLAWSERVPKTTRVLILDMNDATKINNDAIVEMRALIGYVAQSHRSLIIAGISRQGFEAIRRSGAGDLIDRGVLFSDLELALARGLVLLTDTKPRT